MKFIRIFVAIAIIFSGVLIFKYLVNHKVKTVKKHIKIFAPKVKVVKINKITQRISFTATGTVKPIHVSLIQPEISGKVIYISKKFLNGQIVNKGEVLFKIEDIDYRATLLNARAMYEKALLNFEKVKEQAKRALSEWNENKSNFKFGKPSPLRLFKPQLKASKAEVEAAKANILVAEKNLERTVIRAPFKGIIFNKKNIDIGTILSKGNILAQLLGIDEVEVVTPVADYDYPLIDFNNKKVKVFFNLKDNIYKYNGIIDRSEKIINNSTQMINVYTIIKNPYKQLQEKIPLFIGAFVEIKLNGKKFNNIAKIPVTSIHGKDEIWIVKNSKLIRKKINILKINNNIAYISGDFVNNSLLITSNLPYISEGMKVRLK